MRQAVLLTGSAHPDLGRWISERLGMENSPVEMSLSCIKESQVNIQVSVRNKDVYVIQTGSCCSQQEGESMNDFLMQLLILIHACRHAAASRIIAVVPYFPYSKVSKKKSSRGPITAKLVADMIRVAGADHVITMDLHAPPIQSFFNIPVDNLLAEPLFVKAIKDISQAFINGYSQHIWSSNSFPSSPASFEVEEFLGANVSKIPFSGLYISSPPSELQMWKKKFPAILGVIEDDARSICSQDSDRNSTEKSLKEQFHSDVVLIARNASETKRVTSLSDKLGVEFAILYSTTSEDSVEEAGIGLKLVGSVTNKIAWIIGDMIEDLSGYLNAVQLVKNSGAKFIALACVHTLLTKATYVQLEQHPDIDLLLFTNSVPLPKLSDDELTGKTRILDISPLLSEAIRRVHHGESVSSLFYKHI